MGPEIAYERTFSIADPGLVAALAAFAAEADAGLAAQGATHVVRLCRRDGATVTVAILPAGTADADAAIARKRGEGFASDLGMSAPDVVAVAQQAVGQDSGEFDYLK